MAYDLWSDPLPAAGPAAGVELSAGEVSRERSEYPFVTDLRTHPRPDVSRPPWEAAQHP